MKRYARVTRNNSLLFQREEKNVKRERALSAKNKSRRLIINPCDSLESVQWRKTAQNDEATISGMIAIKRLYTSVSIRGFIDFVSFFILFYNC